ncbi:MAG: alpha/beta hydrolase [Alphaproteobacteria bacterium]|nr:alpha/beta hydrolase [Alphaproteobacteria bacterium]
MHRPFVQLPFRALPEHPRLPHGWYDLAPREVVVDSPGLGPVRTSYVEVGEGPPLVLLHGLMTTGYSFRYVVEPLARRFRVLVPDLPGSGRSATPDAPHTPEAVADWLVAFLDATGARGGDLVGNSMGGYLALWAVLRDPEAVGRLLVLHAPAVPSLRLRALWAAIRLPGSEAVLGALIRREPRRWAHRNVHYFDETLKSLEEAAEYGDVLTTRDGLRGFHRHLRDVMDVRAVARLGRRLRSEGALPCPTTLVYAKADPMVPPSDGVALASWLPTAELVWLDRGSHFAHVDAADAFLEVVDRVLA